MSTAPDLQDDGHGRAAASDRIGRRVGMTGGQVWTIAVLAVVIVLLLSSLRGLS